ncbi:MULTISPECIES: RNA polymerase sigma factor [Spirosoma]|uniref:Sigma-70 family RNA polymerase sigma factor n=1 Tax=Spirosoma liriopis TaxID=2937440 RepID=A0ABT0HN58_9BACT|nr:MULTISPECIES: sigma-70 family RNA polymerase sigma factor [Spirosoma]MCK8493607.1 sigma-70 family RNA polymerase sigma factor [Spirosoma liriopis]UHG93016.1 sigma-70 family RNA polymerase sigma factor [Spirosoma oryzicola]
MAAFFRNSVNKVATQSSPDSFQQNEQALYQALTENNQRAWDYLMIQVHNQFVVPQSRQNYDYDTLISAYTEGMAVVKDKILSGRFSHEKAKVTTYAYSVCRFTLLNMYDKDKRRQEVSPFAEQAADDSDESSGISGEEKAEWLLQNEVDDHSWALEPLKIALSGLKDRCQTILQLFYIDDVPDREAARQLGINEANLRQQRRNCVLSLRQSFNQLKKSYL